MCGTSPTALSAYSRYKARSAPAVAPARRIGAAVGRDGGAIDGEAVERDAGGQKVQQSAVSSSAIVPSPIQVSTSPQRSSSGISVPEAAMPIPTPRRSKPAPPTRSTMP